MPSIPQHCQALATKLEAARAAEDQIRSEAVGLVGQPLWETLAKLGEAVAERERAQLALDECIAGPVPSLSGDLVVIDVSGEPKVPALEAELWVRESTGLRLAETRTWSDGKVGFTSPVTAGAILAVRRAGPGGGYEYRGDLAVTQTLRLELVRCPPLSVPMSELRRWAASPPTIPPFEAPGGLGRVTAQLNQLNVVSLAGSEVRVTGTGMAHATAGPLSGGREFSIDVSFGITPSTRPDPGDDNLADVTVRSASVQLPGLFGSLLKVMQPVLLGLVRDRLHAELRHWFGAAVTALVLRRFGLTSLPDGASLSMPAISVDSDGITAQVVIGAQGTALSTFQLASA
jgi:hypothetical protein